MAGSRERQLVGVGLQMTTPGVPMVLAGDEIGLEGDWGEDARRTMPWHRPETWDTELLDAYRRLIALRRSPRARPWWDPVRTRRRRRDRIPARGRRREVLCLARRAAREPVRLPLDALGGTELETLSAGDGGPIDGGEAVLPAAGPAFHAWRIHEREAPCLRWC